MKQSELITNIYNTYIKLKKESSDQASLYLCSNDELKNIIRNRLIKYNVRDVNELCFEFIFKLTDIFDKYDRDKLDLNIYFNTNLRYYILNYIAHSKNNYGGSKNQNIRIMKSIKDNPLNYNLKEEEIIKLFKEKSGIKKDSKALEYLKLIEAKDIESFDENIYSSTDNELVLEVNDKFIEILKEDRDSEKGLSDRECEIFIKCFIDSIKQVELAKEYNVSKQYINKIKRKGINILKNRISIDNVSNYTK